ncbi:MAG: type I restriction enzyme HsdR N-terminal domain-containing protein [bacterium]|jgi:hypothetical protein
MSLNLPSYTFSIRRNEDGGEEVFDPVRKKYVPKTPEEWVRLHFIRYLIREKNYPESLIAVEKGLTVNKLKKRFDAVIYSRAGMPKVLVEFKAPGIRIDQKVFDQVSAYNLKLKVRYLMVSNGMQHYCCQFDDQQQRWIFLNTIPDYSEI